MQANEIRNTVDEGFNRIKSGTHEAMDTVVHASSQAGEALTEKGEQLHNIEQRLVKNCRGYVSDNPIVSLGIAACAGFLLSRLLSSR